MEDQIKTLEKKIEDQNSRFNEQNRKFEELMSMMTEIKDLSSNLKDVNSHLAELSRGLNTGGIDSNTSSLGYVPILGLPKFDSGTYYTLWIKECSKFFSLSKIPDQHRVEIATLSMIDEAEDWIPSYMSVRKNVDGSIL